jgi:Fe-S-cluster-containing hydrogenase component 2
MLRISKDLFAKMLEVAPQLREEARRVVKERAEQTRRRMQVPVWQEEVPAALTARYDELGLIQGQKLMVIDLDRCTRCDKCVEACVAAHQDGRTRLFLDGPRFFDYAKGQLTNYLVPATCRQCKDAVCLVGCPVGSIHKEGETGQIIIESWCIGCETCAKQCLYGAIQMHHVGILQRTERGWRFGPTANGPVLLGQMPFHYHRAFRDRCGPATDLTFRREFALSPKDAKDSKSFHLQVLSMAPTVEVLINGRSVKLEDVRRKVAGGEMQLRSDRGVKWSLEAYLDRESHAKNDSVPHLQRVLRQGRNEVTVRVRLTANEGQAIAIKDEEVLLELGLYGVFEPIVPRQLLGENSQILPENLQRVAKTAVVCDMCGGQSSERTACVNACPHEAAYRVEARKFFPAVSAVGHGRVSSVPSAESHRQVEE